MSRKFYACKCLFKKGQESLKFNFGKVVYVFKSITERDAFVKNMNNESEYFAIKQKEAYAVMNLNKVDSKAGVYRHSEWRDVYILADLKQCYGESYLTIEEFANS